jgi:uncharacterized protein with FMN-binding domain
MFASYTEPIKNTPTFQNREEVADMAARMDTKLLALCTAAIGIIYTAGYVVTEPGIADLGKAEKVAAAAPNTQNNNQQANNDQQSNGTSQFRHGGRGGMHGGDGQLQGGGLPDVNGQAPNLGEGSSGNGNSGSSSSSQAPSAVQGATFKDGTYTGMGQNRIGAVEVAVTIKSNKITNVEITDCSTKYPQSRIDHLPAQVVERQSTAVDAVSGATKSVQDFVTAVSQALAQAQDGSASSTSSTDSSSTDSTSSGYSQF